MRKIILLCVAGLLLVPAATHAAISGPDVIIENFSYTPQTFIGTPTGAPTWSNAVASTHTVTSTFPGYLVSGPLDQYDGFQKTDPVAGTFPYHCDFHPSMLGTYVVDMTATPGTPTVGDLLSIRVASGTTVPDNLAVKLQARKPRADRWMTLQAATTTSINTVAMTKPGAWKFRARARYNEGGTTAVSGWSRTLKVLVEPT